MRVDDLICPHHRHRHHHWIADGLILEDGWGQRDSTATLGYGSADKHICHVTGLFALQRLARRRVGAWRRERKGEKPIKITFEGRKSRRLETKTKQRTDEVETSFSFLQGETSVETRMLFSDPPSELIFKIKIWTERLRLNLTQIWSYFSSFALFICKKKKSKWSILCVYEVKRIILCIFCEGLQNCFTLLKSGDSSSLIGLHRQPPWRGDAIVEEAGPSKTLPVKPSRACRYWNR